MNVFHKYFLWMLTPLASRGIYTSRLRAIAQTTCKKNVLISLVSMWNCTINGKKVNVRCDTRASDACRDVKWAGKCKLGCSKLRRIPEPALGLWTVADFAASKSRFVSTPDCTTQLSKKAPNSSRNGGLPNIGERNANASSSVPSFAAYQNRHLVCGLSWILR